ncbi:hypothetical protein PoB_002846100 [Plakobranchus ocellatus]|uniref:Uncharacterized protein n=1 Tax=Plakobranchus ocellatus TaxID=259542 RepID=A0AAV4A1C7_9GAST|nr:hypothetical protein PoB_002846100 [Plakobranchus ocellatus]
MPAFSKTNCYGCTCPCSESITVSHMQSAFWTFLIDHMGSKKERAAWSQDKLLQLYRTHTDCIMPIVPIKNSLEMTKAQYIGNLKSFTSQRVVPFPPGSLIVSSKP